MLEAIFLGIIQGLTEFLPISSSAHVRIVGEFLPGAKDPGATFTAIMQIGTEIAVLIYFRKEILRILNSSAGYLFGKRDALHEARLGLWILIGSIPIFVLGYFGQSYIRDNFRSLWLISLTLIIFGLLLGFMDHYGKKIRELDSLNARDGLWYGMAQAMALIPGVSRSGATIAMGRLLGYKREAALKYSFLLAVPAVLGSGSYELLNSLSEPTNNFTLAQTAVATLVAFLIGYAVIAWLMKFVQTKSFLPFVVYRVVLGTTMLLLLSLNIVSP